ncbi:MAG: glycosyltransferase family 2 protein [Planctomycetes bacterium]|nr:glycosyltransferase family 2 protein [Planctomycetota bacterium]
MELQTRGPVHTSVIIPALNEEQAIGRVIADIPADLAEDVIVVDNGSTDATADAARGAGARVVHEPERGYGAACLRGIACLAPRTDVVVFLDGDYSDHPDEMVLLLDPIRAGAADMVIGSRALGRRQKGAMPFQARFGNRLACILMRLLFHANHTDLGPFRAITRTALEAVQMRDRGYGWTIEMQIKAARLGLRVREVPVSYRVRIGRSKISGTVRGAVGAGVKILYTILKYAVMGW